ncbi:putative 2OG-Fe(II) oxygenase [Brevundimonas sp.]|uniref:putative 2OG-Fe(II) oxygenase n=1 Tax=Brevundimonas sp. TaxID=1871086 RepID=UPI002AB83BE4|nr:putative 2OG-Fe(II) oxygenase [Brevundimonas sp.]MDZ4362526.1 putative 2OG-Fe(II) oxygenase [Brevundimonas sp.]
MTAADPVQQARSLAAAGRMPEAIALLKQAGRLDVALDLRRGEVKQRPASAVAEHNLASILGDMGRATEAEAAARRALAKGGEAPETWLVLARALLAQDRFDDAQKAYGQALSKHPTYAEAVRDLAQLIWMRTGDEAAALLPFQPALDAAPGSVDLRIARATVMEYTGATPDAVWSALQPDGTDAGIELAATQAALGFDPVRALEHARAAHALRPDGRTALKLAEVYLAARQAQAALPLIEAVLAARPADQSALGLLAVALRQMDDPRAAALYDYGAMIRGWTIDTPAPWKTLPDYLRDLARALGKLHRLTTHPLGQSLRHGTQTTASLLASRDPAIRAFFRAIDRPIRAHIAALGGGDDPLRRRITGDYRLSGAWSVRLGAGGYHAAHVHPEGWLSSACYIDLPDAVDGADRQGWIGFGGPPFAPDLPHQHFEKPEPGKLVLFPSYMWHGTIPFQGDQTRLTIAFDVVPA